VNPYGRKDGGRRGLMLRGPWDASCARVIKQERLTAIYLNSAKGWIEHDVGFLREVPEIEEVGIIAPSVSGLEALECLKRLKELEITCSTQSVVDFTQLPVLDRIYVYWWPGAASLFRCSSLTRVHLDKVTKFPQRWAAQWGGLRELTLANCALTEISEVSALPLLEKLELLNLKRITDYSPIAQLGSLRWLAIRGCKSLLTLDIVRSLHALEVLLIEDAGNIESLEPLRSLTNLQAVSFVGTTTIVDGDLGVLDTLPRLSMLGFGPRRHYTHKLVKPWAWSNFGKPDKLLERK